MPSGRKPLSKPSKHKIVNVRGVEESAYEWLRTTAFRRRCSMGQVLTEAVNYYAKNAKP